MTANPCPAHLAAALGGIPQLAAAAAARKAADSSPRLQTAEIEERLAHVSMHHELAEAIDDIVHRAVLVRQADAGVLEADRDETLAWLDSVARRLPDDLRARFDEVQHDYAAMLDALALLKSRRCTADHMVRTIDGQQAGVCLAALASMSRLDAVRAAALVHRARTALARQRTLLEGLAAEVR